MFRSLKTVTIHKLSGAELGDAIYGYTGHRVNPVSDGDVPGGDSCGHLKVTVPHPSEISEGNRRAYDRFCGDGQYGSSVSIIRTFLTDQAALGQIPTGTYQIEYNWG